MCWWLREAFGFGEADCRRLNELIGEWNLSCVYEAFLDKVRESITRNGYADVVGLLYEALAEEANSLLGEELFVVFPNHLDTQIYCRDEESVREFLSSVNLDNVEKRILEVACREAGVIF